MVVLQLSDTAPFGGDDAFGWMMMMMMLMMMMMIMMTTAAMTTMIPVWRGVALIWQWCCGCTCGGLSEQISG